MGAREEILGRLQAQANPVTMPSAWVSRRQFDDLTVQFDEALTAVSGEVIRVADFDDAIAALGGLLRELGVEKGVVLIESGAGKSRLATLLPPVHIVLLPAERITADLLTWTAARGALPPTNMTLVSGPSKTADIEQTLAVGVHGTKRFVVIVWG